MSAETTVQLDRDRVRSLIDGYAAGIGAKAIDAYVAVFDEMAAELTA